MTRAMNENRVLRHSRYQRHESITFEKWGLMSEIALEIEEWR